MPLGQRSDCGDAKYAGVEIPYSPDIAEQLEVQPHLNCRHICSVSLKFNQRQ